LDDAIHINVLGTLRMYDLSVRCKKCVNFCHISTCYVNSDKKGWIEEKIYDYPENSLELMKELLKIPSDEILK